MSRKIYIYGLREVGETEIRYIGQSVTPRIRFSMHKSDAKRVSNNPKRLWIADVFFRCSDIELVILDECLSCEDAVIREDFWIKHYSATGHRLTNTNPASKSAAGYADRREEAYRLYREEYNKKYDELRRSDDYLADYYWEY